jgi:Sulfotransferase family
MRTAGPDFFIVGAPKAGTTWLYRNLAHNPRLFLPQNKEPRYYAAEEGERVDGAGPGDAGWLADFVRDRGAYEGLFAATGEGQLIGEASSDYLYRSEVAAGRIAADRPEARIVVLLRDPVERAHSNWLHLVREGHETLPFAAALAAEEGRVAAGWAWWWHYGRRGAYAEQLLPFLERFPADQVLLAGYEEIGADPAGLLRRVSGFLGVEPVLGAAAAASRNASLVPRSPAHRAARRLLAPNRVARAVLPQRLRSDIRHRVNRATLHRPALAAEDRRRLRRAYAPELRRLAGMIDLDLSAWAE